MGRRSSYADARGKLLIIGQVHTHPNTDAEGYHTTPTGNTGDVSLSRDNNIPVYYFDNDHLDVVMPNATHKNNYQKSSNVKSGSFSLGVDALKTFSSIRNDK